MGPVLGGVVGTGEGNTVGESDGVEEGIVDGAVDGNSEGSKMVATRVRRWVAWMVHLTEKNLALPMVDQKEKGMEVGSDVGFAVGLNVGSSVGTRVGWRVGRVVGRSDGNRVGREVGFSKLELLLERMAAMWELQVLQSVALLAESSVLELETQLDASLVSGWAQM